MNEPLIINGFDQAIAESPHKGFSYMSRVDIESFPGALKAGKDLASLFHASYTSTFTAVAATDICTATATVPENSTAVVLTTTGTLPAGLSTATNYFVIKLSATTFKLATTITNSEASTPIDITDTGTGTHTLTTVNPATIKHMVKDPRTGVKFGIDGSGRVWYTDGAVYRLLNGNTLTSAEGNGLAILWNSDDSAMWLFVFRNAVIDVIDVYGTTNLRTPAWNNNAWQSMNSGAGAGERHYAITGQDGVIYFTDDRYVGSILEKPGQVFAPGTSATYTYNSQALDTPINETLVHLEEQGVNLLAAGSSSNKIYPWDRVSDSFNLPLAVPENNVQRMKNIGGTVYILAGTWGNIYATQGTYVYHFKKIPQQIMNNADSLSANPITWGGIDAINGKLLFGMTGGTAGSSGSYLLYPDGRLVMDQIPTAGDFRAEVFDTTNNFYQMGYNGGIDTHETDRYNNFEGVVHSGFYRVATKVGKAQYSNLEVVMAKPSSSGGCRISYRTDTTGAFTILDTFNADGVNTTFRNDAIGLIDIENIQIQIEIDDDFELVEVRLLP